jgi:hypothetical protein
MGDGMRVEYYSPNGETPILFGYDPPYGLVHIGGIGRNAATPATVRGPGQRGTTLRDIVINEKVVTLTITVLDVTGDEATYWGLRAALERQLTVEPGDFGDIPEIGLLRFYREGNMPVLEMPAVPRESPQYTAEGPFWTDADLEFVCPTPFPREITDRFFNLAGAGGFEFPAAGIDMVAVGIEFPSYNFSADVMNGGDVEAPILVNIYGEVTNPIVKNDTIAKEIRYLGTINAGDHVEISTRYGEKTVTYVTAAGVRTSVMQNINHAVSRFWSLRPGFNRVSFSASVNNAGYANVYWRQHFGGM